MRVNIGLEGFQAEPLPPREHIFQPHLKVVESPHLSLSLHLEIEYLTTLDLDAVPPDRTVQEGAQVYGRVPSP
ncbi:hypothetical protein ACFL0D_03050 [Thermoproteota archaeon]